MKLIYQTTEGGISVATAAPGKDLRALASKIVPAGSAWKIVPDDAIPTDRVFRDAWKLEEETLVEDLSASREIAHNLRREKRSEEFRPHDELMAVRIPGTDEEGVEASRQEIRDRYAVIEQQIDDCETVEELHEQVNTIY